MIYFIVAAYFIRAFMWNVHMFECPHRHLSTANPSPCHFFPHNKYEIVCRWLFVLITLCRLRRCCMEFPWNFIPWIMQTNISHAFRYFHFFNQRHYCSTFGQLFCEKINKLEHIKSIYSRGLNIKWLKLNMKIWWSTTKTCGSVWYRRTSE